MRRGVFIIPVIRRYTQIYKEVHHSWQKVELKKPVVAEISENIKDAQAVVLVSYCGITVEADTALRKELRELVLPTRYTRTQ